MSPEAELALAPQNSKLILSRFTQWCREQPCQGSNPSLPGSQILKAISFLGKGRMAMQQRACY